MDAEGPYFLFWGTAGKAQIDAPCRGSYPTAEAAKEAFASYWCDPFSAEAPGMAPVGVWGRITARRDGELAVVLEWVVDATHTGRWQEPGQG